MLKIIRVVTGYLEENCYIIYNNKNALIIDPGDNKDKIISEIEKNQLNVIGILLTHSHFDHIGALDDILDAYSNLQIFDYNKLGNNKIDDFEFKTIRTSGHTFDSVSFYFEKDNILFSGDFVFKETIGNYEEENKNDMISSLKKLKTMNKDMLIYPGHGESTTLDHELKYNPFLRGI